MSCNSSNPFIVYPTQYSQTNCEQCTDPACGTYTPTKCIYYSGPALPCIGVETNDNLELILQKVETKICEATGDYSTYDTACLTSITTQQQFVEAISAGYCDLLAEFNQFVNIDFPASQTAIEESVTTVDTPGITCTVAGVVPTDTVSQVLEKYCELLTALNTMADVSTANWNSCYSVSPLPSTPIEGFNTLIDQICNLQSQVDAGSLGTFDNTCIGGSTTEDAATSIQGLLDRMCSVPTFNPATLTFGCVTAPGTLDLQNIVQTILTSLTDYFQNKLTFSGDFSVSLVDPMNPCLGKSVELTTPLDMDRFVAASPTDTSPATLFEKLDAGPNISIDDTTTPGKVTISSTAPAESFKVKAAPDGSDTEDYLIGKVEGQANILDGLSISESYSAITEKVGLYPSVDWTAFISKWFAELNSNSTLALLFCSQVQACIDSTSACFSFSASLNITYASSGTINYIDCDGNAQILTLTTSSSTSTFCAQRLVSIGSYVSVDNLGACAGTSTTSGTTATPPYNLEVINASSDGIITEVSPMFYYTVTGAFPVNTSETYTGMHGDFTGGISVTYTPPTAGGTLELYKNGVLLHSETLALVPSIFSFGSYPFLSTDLILLTMVETA